VEVVRGSRRCAAWEILWIGCVIIVSSRGNNDCLRTSYQKPVEDLRMYGIPAVLEVCER
jgi:hypothetical protein